MPDQRQHRGPHPQDPTIFAASSLDDLRRATGDLSWLLSRGYAVPSSLKIVGDRYKLSARQRLAVSRSACSDDSLDRRRGHQQSTDGVRGRELWIDGYNVLTSVEAALGGGVILLGRDSCFRDMASMHGSYRKVQETVPAIHRIGQTLDDFGIKSCRWLLDRPVSNSGRLKQWLLEQAEEHDWHWEVDLVADPDPVLCQSHEVVASADSQILDRADRWFNLAREVIEVHVPEAWVVPMA